MNTDIAWLLGYAIWRWWYEYRMMIINKVQMCAVLLPWSVCAHVCNFVQYSAQHIFAILFQLNFICALFLSGDIIANQLYRNDKVWASKIYIYIYPKWASQTHQYQLSVSYDIVATHWWGQGLADCVCPLQHWSLLPPPLGRGCRQADLSPLLTARSRPLSG